MTRRQQNRVAMFALAFAALIGASLAYDQIVGAVSSNRATLTARHAKCGPVTNSGPKDAPGLRSLKRYMLMARLDDGNLVRVERRSIDLPPCGATLAITERVTPWGTLWYWTEQ